MDPASAALILAAVAVLCAGVLLAARELRRLGDRLDASERRAEAAEAAPARRPSLVGELVVVNTPQPDDQSLRGIVRHELDNGGLVLTAAVYIDREHGRGGESTPVEVPAGDVYVPSYSWAQIVQATHPHPSSPAAGL